MTSVKLTDEQKAKVSRCCERLEMAKELLDDAAAEILPIHALIHHWYMIDVAGRSLAGLNRLLPDSWRSEV